MSVVVGCFVGSLMSYPPPFSEFSSLRCVDMMSRYTRSVVDVSGLGAENTHDDGDDLLYIGETITYD